MHLHHTGCSHDLARREDARLGYALGFNLLLSVVEIVAGILSGSLSLIADAVHNFQDCVTLGVSLVARRIARRKADRKRTFGYRRAETIAALINLTALMVVAMFLGVEALQRYFDPQPIDGWLVVWTASLALAVDLATVVLLSSMARDSLNVRAAMLHNFADALTSAGVIVAGVAVILWQAYYVDLIATVVIAAYIIWHSYGALAEAIVILMDSAPVDINIDELVAQVESLPGVVDLHHLHLRYLDEVRFTLEAHVVIRAADAPDLDAIKQTVKEHLATSFGITHSTLEFELDTAADHDMAKISDH